MKSYITKPKSVRRNKIFEKEYSFSVTGYYKVPISTKWNYLEDIIESEAKGQDMEEKDFLHFPTKSKYLKTASLTGNNLLLDELSDNTFEYISPELNLVFRNKKRQIKKYDILYTSTGSNNRIGDCALATQDLYHNFSSHIFLLKPICNTFYLFAILKSQYGKDSCDLQVPKAGIMRRGGKRFLKIKIPFPTIKNYPNPEQIENFIALIVQNIIDKEEQIKLKNKQIDELIEKELKENQKAKNFMYRYPRISEIRQETRLDTGLYEREFKIEDFKIENYYNGYSNIFDLEYEISRGQNLQISNIGESYYSDSFKPNFYKLILSKYFTGRTYEKVTYLGNRKKLKTIEIGDIIFSCRGEMGRSIIFPEKVDNTITNIDNVHISSKKRTLVEKLFLFCFLGYLKEKNILDSIACTGSGAPSFTQYQFSKLKIPDFPESKQQEIAKLYYNPLEKNKDTNLENYLEREKLRNREVGIFQLNMEIFELREKLEDLVDAVVMERGIEIVF